MNNFWVKEAVSILRQNGSRECAEAVDALAARLAEAVELLASARGKIDTLTIQGKGCQRDIDAFLARERPGP
jgi:hypothetical protein